MKIVEYVQKRDILGRFKPNKSKVFKGLFVLIVVSSFVTNYFLAKQIWNFRCEVNGQIIGYFTRDTICGEMYQAKFDSLELDRINRVANKAEEQAKALEWTWKGNE